MKKNTNKYSMQEVIDGVCNGELVQENWPISAKLTVTEMLKIGIDKGLYKGAMCDILVHFDRAMWDKLNRYGKPIMVTVKEYIALEE